MGHAQGLSMLYLEARCVVRRARGRARRASRTARSRCVALVLAVPGGTRAILAENVLAAWLDLEVASGNDAIASHSPIRKTAKLMGQFLPGTDFVTSGYSIMGRRDNTFGGGNYDADDIDEWLTIQRDWQVDGGIEPIEEDGGAPRARARRAGGAGRVRRARPAGRDRRRGRGRDDRPRQRRHARPRPRSGRRGRRRAPRPRRLRARRRARPRPARLRGRRRGGRRHAAPAHRGGLPPDVRGDRARRARPVGGERPEPLPRARDRLPARGGALGAPAVASARRRPAAPRRGGRGRGRDRGGVRAGRARRRPGRGRDRRRPCLRGRRARDDRRAAARRGPGRGRRRRARGGRLADGSSGSCGRRTWRSSATTVPCSPARVSRSGSSRRGRR